MISSMLNIHHYLPSKLTFPFKYQHSQNPPEMIASVPIEQLLRDSSITWTDTPTTNCSNQSSTITNSNFKICAKKNVPIIILCLATGFVAYFHLLLTTTALLSLLCILFCCLCPVWSTLFICIPHYYGGQLSFGQPLKYLTKFRKPLSTNNNNNNKASRDTKTALKLWNIVQHFVCIIWQWTPLPSFNSMAPYDDGLSNRPSMCTIRHSSTTFSSSSFVGYLITVLASLSLLSSTPFSPLPTTTVIASIVPGSPHYSGWLIFFFYFFC